MHGAPGLCVIASSKRREKKAPKRQYAQKFPRQIAVRMDGWVGKASAAFPCRGDGRSAAWVSRRIDAGLRHPCLGVGRATNGRWGKTGQEGKHTKKKTSIPEMREGVSAHVDACISEIIIR